MNPLKIFAKVGDVIHDFLHRWDLYSTGVFFNYYSLVIIHVGLTMISLITIATYYYQPEVNNAKSSF